MILFACGAGNSPQKVGEKFLKAMEAGNFSEAKKYATRKAQDQIDQVAGLSNVGASGHPEDIVVGEVEDFGDRATLHYTDGGNKKTLEMIKQDGEWKANWTKASHAGNEVGGMLEDGIDKAFESVEDGLEKGLDDLGKSLQGLKSVVEDAADNLNSDDDDK